MEMLWNSELYIDATLRKLIISVQGNEYHVQFASVLSIIANTGTKKIRIISEGTAIRTTPQYPENVTGFFFKNYQQTYLPYEN